MKKRMLALFVVFSMAIGFSVPFEASAVEADSQIIRSLDLTKTKTFYSETEQGQQISVFGKTDTATVDLTGSEAVSYSSGNPGVATVDEDGRLSVLNTGYTIVTASVTNSDGSTVSSKIIIHVYRDKQAYRDFEQYTVPDPEKNTHIQVITDPVRTGTKAIAYKKYEPGIEEPIAEKWSLLAFNPASNATKVPQCVGEGWFYDSGERTNAKSQIRVQSHDRDRSGAVYPMTLHAYFGVIDDTQDYYMYSNAAAHRTNVGPGGTNLVGTDQAGTGYVGDHVVGNTLLDGQAGRPCLPRSQGWHQVVVVVNGGDNWDNVGTANGTITAYIDGVEIYTEHYVPNTLQAIGGVNIYPNSGTAYSVYDDIGVYHYYTNQQAPSVSNVSINGTARSAQVMTAVYTYSDVNGDSEDTDGTLYQWQSSEDGTTFTDVEGAVFSTFAPRYADAGKYFRVGVSVRAVNPPYQSEMVYSQPTEATIGETGAKAQLFSSIDITKTPSVYPENATGAQIIVWGVNENGRYDITQAADMMYESSNRQVAEVGETGALTIKSAGQTVIKVTYANYDNSLVSAQMMLHVYQDGLTQNSFDTYTVPLPEQNPHVRTETQNTRTGAQAVWYQTKPSSGATVHTWGLDLYSDGSKVPSKVGEGWFYDSGEHSGAKAAIYFQSHNIKDAEGTSIPLTLAVRIGVLDDTKDYYMVTNLVSGRADVGSGATVLSGTEQAGTGYTGDRVVLGKQLDGTGGFGNIPRSKGWHQVVCIVDGGTTQENVGTDQGTICVYIDGILAYTEHYVPLNLHVVRGVGMYANGSQASSLYDDLSLYRYIPQPEPIEYFVAVNGSDDNDGSIDAPFATIQKARDTVRTIAANAQAPIYVNLREGVYPISSTITFNANNSGTETAPITYRSYPGEKAELIGGKILDSSAITPVTDTAVLNRIIDPLARQRLVQVDLASQGISSVPEINDYGFGISTVYRPMEFYFNNTALTLARWPNNEPNQAYVKTGSVAVSQSNPNSGPFSVDYVDSSNRSALWNLTGKTDLFIAGFVAWDWAFGAYRVASLNKTTNVITTVNGTPYAPNPNHMIYFFNLLEEIDQPGECYVDRENLKLYFYPTTQDIHQELKVATLDNHLIRLEGTRYVTLEDLSFGVSRNTAVYANQVDHFAIDGCTFSKLSANAVYLYGTNSAIRNSYIYDTGAGGITVGGGNRQTLTASNNEIYNNRIHNVNRIYRSYKAALQVNNACGLRISNNEIYDGPHQLISLGSSNDIELIYNNIYGGVKESGDMGAVYWGRNLSALGYKIMYNYFHHIGNEYAGGDSGNTGPGQQAVFWDDGTAGPYFYGNIIYQGGGNIPGKGYAIKTNGGQYAMVKNNIFVDASSAFYSYQWNGGSTPGVPQTKWYYYIQGKDENGNDIPANAYIYNNYTQTVNYKSEEWLEHYRNTMWAWQYSFIEDGPPKDTNQFTGNLSVKIGNQVGGWAVQTNNAKFAQDPGFISYGSDFRLTESGLAQVRQTAPDFENIPTYKIGLRTAVGGAAPAAAGLSITNANGLLQATYQYTDEDGDPEGYSEIIWYSADTQEGPYQRISGKRGRELLTGSAETGKYIRFTVKPYDQTMRYGETVTSDPIYIPS